MDLVQRQHHEFPMQKIEIQKLKYILSTVVASSSKISILDQIETKQRRFQSTQNDVEENVTKVHMLEDHLKNVQDELGTTQVRKELLLINASQSFVPVVQRLCNARKNEIETEEHMKMLNERELGRLKQDILRLENEITNIKDRKSGLAVSPTNSVFLFACKVFRLFRMKFFVPINYSTK